MQTPSTCPASALKRQKGIAFASAPQPQEAGSGPTEIILQYRAMLDAGISKEIAYQTLRGAEVIATGQVAQIKVSLKLHVSDSPQ